MKKEVIGIDFGGHHIRAGLVKNNKIKNLTKISINGKDSFKTNYQKLISVIDSVITKNTKAIGIGVPGTYNSEKGIIKQLTNVKSWKNINIRKLIKNKYKIPAYVNNDANCFALSEAIAGKGKNKDIVVGVILGTGLGIGTIIKNKILDGANSCAGEIGYLNWYKDKTKLKHEDFCNKKFVEKQAKINTYDLLKNKNNFKTKFNNIMKQFGTNIGYTMAIIINLVNPDIIVIGGGMKAFFPYFKTHMIKELKTNIHPDAAKKINIKKSDIKNPGVLGAALLCENV